MFCASVVVFVLWWRIVRKYCTVVDEGANLIVGYGVKKIIVSKRNIKTIEEVPYLRLPVFKISALTSEGLTHFYFVASPGVTEESILNHGADDPTGS